jgi:hypothetical protein
MSPRIVPLLSVNQDTVLRIAAAGRVIMRSVC